ncbi:SpaH/EbpB family LPXTG-anchored major pilin [Neoactinobaculum massilliense]|uniref:SpaH/EbpB family LPXTG-anchored major pilin n=1 Tax=Neoactinobaculum massilliense TaxID=2364794 RepID=UPI000F533667|nr:SpaH/EbpB family LPXTG-anchored major pilin [Neoactinobaculum massilliense]
MKNTKSLLTAFVAAVVALFAGILGFSPAAHADVPSASHLTTLDTSKDATLIIHKYAGNNSGTSNQAGEEVSPAPTQNPIAGVTFHVQKVNNIDLTTTEGWDAASALQSDGSGIDTTQLGTATDLTTDANGEATGTFPLGVYYVTETAPAGVTASATPFVVVLPQPAGTKGWNYSVNVYPKNQVDEGNPTKTVDDSNAVKAGDIVSYTLTSGNLGGSYSAYEITDTLDPSLALDANSIVVKLGDTTLTADTDYTVSGNFKIAFTPAGLAKVNSATALTKITVTFNATVTDGGVINNTASFTNNSGTTTDTNTATTKWGKVKISKTDADNGTALAGAVFEVYATDADGAKTGNALYTLTTDSHGTVTSDVLKEGKYILVETKAPTGYVKAADTTVTVTAGETADASIALSEITDAKETVPGLPLTGAQGTAILVTAGVLLVAAGAVLAIVRRRSNRA